MEQYNVLKLTFTYTSFKLWSNNAIQTLFTNINKCKNEPNVDQHLEPWGSILPRHGQSLVFHHTSPRTHTTNHSPTTLKGYNNVQPLRTSHRIHLCCDCNSKNAFLPYHCTFEYHVCGLLQPWVSPPQSQHWHWTLTATLHTKHRHTTKQ